MTIKSGHSWPAFIVMVFLLYLVEYQTGLQENKKKKI